MHVFFRKNSNPSLHIDYFTKIVNFGGSVKLLGKMFSFTFDPQK